MNIFMRFQVGDVSGRRGRVPTAKSVVSSRLYLFFAPLFTLLAFAAIFLSTESFVIGKDAAEGKSSGRVHLLFAQASRLSATLLPHLIRDLRKMLRCSLIVDESCGDFPSLCFYVCVE